MGIIVIIVYRHADMLNSSMPNISMRAATLSWVHRHRLWIAAVNT